MEERATYESVISKYPNWGLSRSERLNILQDCAKTFLHVPNWDARRCAYRPADLGSCHAAG
jgi:hypothetical protein